MTIFRMTAATVALSAGLSAGALAQGADPLEPILSCAEIEADAERLACYDAQAQTLSGSVRSGDIVAVEREAVEAVERDGFGLSLPSLPALSFNLFGGGSETGGEADAETRARSAGIADAEDAESVRVVERAQSGEIDKVMMTIERVDTIGYSTLRFVMTNGQVWDQTDTDRVNIPRARGDARNQAEIRRAGAGGFFLRVNGEGRAVRVQRVQ